MAKSILLLLSFNILINTFYSQILYPYKGVNNKFGLKDQKGNVIAPPIYDSFFSTYDGKLDFSETAGNERLAAFEKDGKMGIA